MWEGGCWSVGVKQHNQPIVAMAQRKLQYFKFILLIIALWCQLINSFLPLYVLFTVELVSFIKDSLCDCKAPVSPLEFIFNAVLALGMDFVFSEERKTMDYNDLTDKNKNIGSACTST